MADTTKAFSFNTFGGADTSIFLMFGKDTSGGKQTIQVGNIAAIQGVIKVEGAPRYVMGEADPQGFSSGKRLISGSVVLESSWWFSYRTYKNVLQICRSTSRV